VAFNNNKGLRLSTRVPPGSAGRGESQASTTWELTVTREREQSINIMCFHDYMRSIRIMLLTGGAAPRSPLSASSSSSSSSSSHINIHGGSFWFPFSVVSMPCESPVFLQSGKFSLKVYPRVVLSLATAIPCLSMA